MTQKQKDYIKRQLIIMQSKSSNDQLQHYERCLDAAKLEPHVKAPLRRACDEKRSELNPAVTAMAVNGDIDDLVD